MNKYYTREAIRAEAQEIASAKAREKRGKYEKHFGVFGKYILEVGTGGGFTAIPHALDMYEGALGLSRDETWLLKRLCRYLPNVHPSMARIANEANTSEPTLSRIKKGLIEKGFIRDNGKHSADALQRDLNISPLFDALFLCALCDPKSKLVTSQAMDRVRTEFTAKWQGNGETEYYAKQEDFRFTDLPLSIEAARKFAERRGIILDWDYIYKMQNGAALEKLETMKADKMRLLELKDAINAGRGESFGIVYGYKKAFQWLKWLSGTNIRPDEVENLTASYVKQTEMPNAGEYMEWMQTILQYSENARILAERDVILAVNDYAES